MVGRKKQRLKMTSCKGCETAFFPKDKRQKYHSAECREAYYASHYFNKVMVDKACPNCGTVFSTSMPQKQAYCSPECRKEAQVRRLEGVAASMSAERITYLTERYATFQHDGYKCTYCGRGAADGVKLDTEDKEGGGLRTICNECKVGKETT